MIRSKTDNRNFVLLTGACGFVGRYVLRDLLSEGYKVVVVVRPSGRNSALSRVQKLMSFCQESTGQTWTQPRIIDWDLCNDSKTGLHREDRKWLASNVKSVIHSAASVRFTLDNKTNEPFETNIHGTRRLLELAIDLRDIDFHHVSTAYVCGQTEGKAFENSLDPIQFKNVYEESKHLAERQLRSAASHLASLTIYRPSIVVGDSKTGYASTFQTVYGGLKLASVLPENQSSNIEALFRWLGLSGRESKNLVPIDWVSAAMVAIFSQPELHDNTYHLTNPSPTTIQQITNAMVQAIKLETDFWASMQSTGEKAIVKEDLRKVFLDSFQNYFCSDPVFDRSQFERAIPNTPIPELDNECLVRMFRFAIRQRFTDAEMRHLPVSALPSGNQNTPLKSSQSELPNPPLFDQAWDFILFETNRERVRWQFRAESLSQPTLEGIDDDSIPQVYVHASILASLAHGQMDWSLALRSSRLVLLAPKEMQPALVKQLKQCLSSRFGQALCDRANPGNQQWVPCSKAGNR